MNNCVVLKLITGEQILATLLKDTENGIVISNPIQIRTMPIMTKGEYNEQTLTNKFCQYTDETEFTFNQRNVIYCKPLHSSMIDHYNKLVLAFGEERPAISSLDLDSPEDTRLDNHVNLVHKYH